MKTLVFNLIIHTTAEHLWNCMWDPEHFKTWTRMFGEGSHYKTKRFAQGETIHFLLPSGEGMYSIIDTLKPNKLMVFKHQGDLLDFKEQPIDNNQGWRDAIESYEITPTQDGVTLQVKVDTTAPYIDHMNTVFPRALGELKKLAEAT